MVSTLKHNYRNLDIWQLGIEIVDKVYSVLENYPNREKFGLYSQMSRSSVSIPSNIAEGSSRMNKSFAHYISIALGSSFELETQLIISKRRNYLSEEEFNSLIELINRFQRKTTTFQKRLQN